MFLHDLFEGSHTSLCPLHHYSRQLCKDFYCTYSIWRKAILLRHDNIFFTYNYRSLFWSFWNELLKSINIANFFFVSLNRQMTLVYWKNHVQTIWVMTSSFRGLWTEIKLLVSKRFGCKLCLPIIWSNLSGHHLQMGTVYLI